MDIKEYISSGIIESYVLGLASAQEKLEFEQYCSQYPELVAAREAFEELLEKQAFQQGIMADGSVKEKLMKSVTDRSYPRNQTNVITMESTNNPSRGNGWLRFVAAAAVVLLVGTAYFAYSYYSKNKKLEASSSALKTELDSANTKMDKMVEEHKVMADPNVRVVTMVGTTKAPQSSANIYWDSTSSNVWLVVKNMPQLPSSQQYQLWALIDGKPKDLGLFDAADQRIILKMNNTQKADAFAITIENRGNTGGPTLEQLQSQGKPVL